MTEREPTDGREAVAEDEAWVHEGLRALRERAPSDESRRTTLARLGVADVPESTEHPCIRGVRPPAPNVSPRGLVRWLVWGVVLGAALIALQRLLG